MSVAEIDIRRPAKLLIGQHPRPGKDLTRCGDHMEIPPTYFGAMMARPSAAVESARTTGSPNSARCVTLS
jgi:hypothetical protein